MSDEKYTTTEVSKTVKEMVAYSIGVDADKIKLDDVICEENPLDNPNLESSPGLITGFVNFIELLLKVEKVFDIEEKISDKAADNINTVQDLSSVIVECLGDRVAPPVFMKNIANEDKPEILTVW